MGINCKAMQERIKVKLKEQVGKLQAVPQLATIIVGDNIASHKYVKNKEKFIAECGMASFTIGLENDVEEDELVEMINMFNADDSVHGILVQLPLPSHINEKNVLNSITPLKDVDGLSKFTEFTPCTPKGIMTILKELEFEPSGKHAMIIGRSDIVGKPMYNLLLENDATTVQIHSKTPFSAPAYVYNMQPQLIISAVGKQDLLTAERLKKIEIMSSYTPEIIIDVGINEIDGKIEGDIKKSDYPMLDELNIKYTTVPGGVGLMTVASLAENLLLAYEKQGGI